MPEKENFNKRISATLLSVFAILTSCALLAFALVGVMFAPDLGLETYFDDETHYQTFKIKIVEVTFDTETITIFAEHTNKNFGYNMMISGANATLALENGAKNLLKENLYVSVTVAPHYIGSNWAYTITGMSYDDTVLLPFETGKQNIVEELTLKSAGISKALIATGCTLAVFATGLVVTIIVVKKKKVFYR